MHVSRRQVMGIAVAAAAATVVLAAGQQAAWNADRKGVAIQGYDVVAYATAAAPRRGRPEFEYRWNGAIWRFESAANREAFAASPERFVPQFGGYCAYAVSRGYTADIDPDAWRIVEGRLYLNYSKRVQRLWEQDIPGNIAKARANWPGVLSK